MSLFRNTCIIEEIMEVEALNLTAWYLTKNLVCLEDIKGGKFDVVCAISAITEEEHYLAV